MRTLVVVRSLKVGGMERVAVNLADAFAAAGHESHLLFFKRRRGGLAPEHPAVRSHHFDVDRAVRRTGVGVLLELVSRVALNVLFRKSHFLWTGALGGRLLARQVQRLEREHGPFDRIIFRGQGTFERVWSFNSPRARFVIENIVADRGRGLKERLFARALYADKHLVAVSTGVAESMREASRRLGVAPRSLEVITNPCPVERIRERANEDCPDVPAEPYIVNVARLVPQKNQRLLLDAYARSGLDAPLVIVGEGRLRADLEARARELGIADRVRFVGNQPNPYPWMKHARLLVLSSRFEGLGVVLLEALACGTPIVSVDCPGGVRDVFQGELSRYLCEPNPDALGSLMSETAANPPAVQDRWIAPFSPRHVVEKFLGEGAAADVSGRGRMRENPADAGLR